MFRFAAPLAFAATLAVAPLWAQGRDADKVDQLFDALGMPQLIEIMREEGLAYGETLATDMLPGGRSAEWSMAVSAIYDVEMMTEEVRGVLGEALEGDDVDAMLAFFTSEQGVRIVGLEISARRALLDDAVEEASKENAAIAMMDETPRFQMVQDFIDANDLIEANVIGALNSNYAFYTGLIDGGAMPAGITLETALQDVWAQEPMVRADTVEWLFSFLLMAYQPLSDEELEAYLAFSRSDAGQDMTNALFEAFNGMFDDISRALGLASSRFMLTQEL
ncbi:ribosomal protein L21 [Loktanella sp. 1ANDIMAR09]|nr:ribosomal protein L21 [Loktanella sp. 1ANDIMAR09]